MKETSVTLNIVASIIFNVFTPTSSGPHNLSYFFELLSKLDYATQLSVLSKAYYHHFVGHCGAFFGLKWKICGLKCILAR